MLINVPAKYVLNDIIETIDELDWSSLDGVVDFERFISKNSCNGKLNWEKIDSEEENKLLTKIVFEGIKDIINQDKGGDNK